MSRNPEVTADLVRTAYPNPRAVPDEENDIVRECEEGEYCVGGAFLKFIGWDCRGRDFPPPVELRKALMQVNPTLPEDRAVDYAAYIVRANDEGRFDDAWNWLEEALE